MTTKNPHWKLKPDKPDKLCNINPVGIREIFLSSSKLISFHTEKTFHPPTDIYETESDIVIRSEIAGMKPEEIVVSFDGHRLIIGGTRYESGVSAKRTFRQMEIEYGKFEKVIEIYCPVEPEQAHASYKDGFLQVVVPKSKKAGSTKAVAIKHIEIIFSA